MFSAPRDSSPRRRSASRSTDDYSTKDRPRRFFQRYVHDLSISSHSLATTSSLHDDLPIPAMPFHASHTTSSHSTPMTSPSTGYSSLFPGSLSSATSESVPNAEAKYQSEFGLLTSSPIHGSASSASSYPASPRSRSAAESDPQSSTHRLPRVYPSSHFSTPPSTTPDSPPASPAPSTADNSPADRHTRSHSRLTVSIKNLLSKSAVPSSSRFSFNSAPPEESEGSRSFHVLASAGKWPMTPRKSRPPDPDISTTVSPAMPSPACTCSAPMDAHRRYASEAVAKLYNATTSGASPQSQECTNVPARNAVLASARGKEPRTRNVLRRRPSGSAKLSKSRERGMSTPAHPREADADRLPLPQGGIPFPLTAASAVVEAYKQQERHCDDTSPTKLSIEDRMSSNVSLDGRFALPEHPSSPSPYCTVFGASLARTSQAGSPEDQWSRSEPDQPIWAVPQVPPSHHPSMSDSAVRSISRKVSTRWRKIKGGVASEESPLHEKGHSKARPSLQELWGFDKPGTRSTGRSIDGVPNEGDHTWASPTESHGRSGSVKTDGSEGRKFWRMMRRISTGGLRDRFQSDKVAPPVPAIPKELLEKANYGEHNEPLSPSRQQPPSPLRDREHTRMSMVPKNIAVARPSVATSSSSPNSSDVASTQFFYKAHSVRSSISSYGEIMAAPPMPDVLDRRIITPLEQLRLADDHTEVCEPSTSSLLAPRSPRRSTSVPVGLRKAEDTEDDRASLLSPRRQTCSGESPSSSRPSSTAASGSGSARTSFQGRGFAGSRREDGIVSLSPPPRPSRNSRRGGSGSVASFSPHSTVMRLPDGTVGMGGARQMDRVPSAQSDMTARLDTPGASANTQLTFRELDAPRRPPLSEQEKASIWDDLLARSDMAGGTLHINGAAELLSDSLRFSMQSEC